MERSIIWGRRTVKCGRIYLSCDGGGDTLCFYRDLSPPRGKYCGIHINGTGGELHHRAGEPPKVPGRPARCITDLCGRRGMCHHHERTPLLPTLRTRSLFSSAGVCNTLGVQTVALYGAGIPHAPRAFIYTPQGQGGADKMCGSREQ